MKLLANENFPLDSVKYLSDKGFDIKSIGVDNMSISDREVMTIAINEGRLILTFDRDYGELIFKYFYQPEMGVIYLRLDKYEPDEPGSIIENLLSNPDFNTSRKLTVVNNDGIRQRSY
jgi:predicted nuclease of predicted toxin-antitoxin system